MRNWASTFQQPPEVLVAISAGLASMIAEEWGLGDDICAALLGLADYGPEWDQRWRTHPFLESCAEEFDEGPRSPGHCAYDEVPFIVRRLVALTVELGSESLHVDRTQQVDGAERRLFTAVVLTAGETLNAERLETVVAGVLSRVSPITD